MVYQQQYGSRDEEFARTILDTGARSLRILLRDARNLVEIVPRVQIEVLKHTFTIFDHQITLFDNLLRELYTPPEQEAPSDPEEQTTDEPAPKS